MPIRLNLLAEAQAAEDLRRRDPVKRAMWIGAFLVALMLGWSVYVFVISLVAEKELNQAKARVTERNGEYQAVIDDQRKLGEVRKNLNALRQLATNRFLAGNLMNALQQTVIDDVALVRLKTDQLFLLNEETKPRTNGDRVLPGKPATVTERIVITLDAKDYSANPGDEVTKYKDVVANASYFQALLGKTNEVRMFNLSQPTHPPDGPAYVSFTLECRLPERTR